MDNLAAYTSPVGLQQPNLDRNLYCNPPPTGGEFMIKKQMVLTDYVTMWLNLYKKNSVKPSTFSRLEISNELLAKSEIGHELIENITPLDVQFYINELTESGYSMSTIKKQLELVNASLKKAVKLKLIDENPAEDIELPNKRVIKKKKRDVKAYDQEEQSRINKVIADDPENNSYQCIAFMTETGLRSGEALALRWSDVNMADVRFHVHSTVVNPRDPRIAYVQDSPKTDSSVRTLPLNAKAMAILKRLKLRAKSEWVFERDGRRLEYPELIWQTKKLCRQARVTYKGEHVFRHTFATNCYYRGVDVKRLSRLLGHSTTTVTYNTYIDLYNDGFDDLYDAVSM